MKLSDSVTQKSWKEAQEEKWISQDLWPISKWMHKDVNASKILLHRFDKLLQDILLIIIWFSILTQQMEKQVHPNLLLRKTTDGDKFNYFHVSQITVTDWEGNDFVSEQNSK